MSLELLVIFLMLLMSAFFSGIEIALLGLTPLNIVQDKSGKLAALLKRKEKLIASTLIGNNITIVASTLALEKLLRQAEPWEQSVGFFLQILIFFLLAEFAPKSFFKQFYKKILSFFYIPISILYYLLWPFSSFFLRITDTIFKIFPKQKNSRLTREDIFLYVDRNVGESPIALTEGIMLLASTRAREIMTPLPDVILVDKDHNVQEVISLLDEYGYTRYPVYQERGDNIIGYINVFDFLNSKSSTKISTLLYKPVFIPETLAADKLLSRMQKENLPMVFVVSEYGSVSGIITLENIAEELVGELVSDSQKAEKPYIQREQQDNFILDGNLDIDDFNREFGCKIVKDGFETLTGYLIHAIGKIPAKGEKISLPPGNFVILEADEKTIDKVSYVLNKKIAALKA